MKYVQFVVIALLAVGLDQWTKDVAVDRLASYRPGGFEHTVDLVVGEDDAGETVREFLADELEWSSQDEVDEISRRWVIDPAHDGRRLRPDTKLEAGQKLALEYRKIVVLDDYWEFEYTRNPGAAFGLLAGHDSPWRLPFFILVSLVAVGIIVFILHGVTIRQQLLIWSLSFIAGGAIGNFIDRVRFGYVIDFIVWMYTDEYRWPTFNVADAFISVGVALMVLEIIRESWQNRGSDEEDA